MVGVARAVHASLYRVQETAQLALIKRELPDVTSLLE